MTLNCDFDGPLTVVSGCFRVLALGVSGLIIAGCSGGSSDTPERFDLASAFAQWQARGDVTRLQAHGACLGGLIDVQRPANEAQAFGEGTARALLREQTVLVNPECAAPSGVTSAVLFVNEQAQLLGWRDAQEYVALPQPLGWPSDARVGDGGRLVQAERFSAELAGEPLGTVVLSYRLQAGDTDEHAWLNLSTERFARDGRRVSETLQRYEVSTTAQLRYVGTQLAGIDFMR